MLLIILLRVGLSMYLFQLAEKTYEKEKRTTTFYSLKLDLFAGIKNLF